MCQLVANDPQLEQLQVKYSCGHFSECQSLKSWHKSTSSADKTVAVIYLRNFHDFVSHLQQVITVHWGKSAAGLRDRGHPIALTALGVMWPALRYQRIQSMLEPAAAAL